MDTESICWCRKWETDKSNIWKQQSTMWTWTIERLENTSISKGTSSIHVFVLSDKTSFLPKLIYNLPRTSTWTYPKLTKFVRLSVPNISSGKYSRNSDSWKESNFLFKCIQINNASLHQLQLPPPQKNSIVFRSIFRHQLTEALSRNSASICLFLFFQKGRNKSCLAATLGLCLQWQGPVMKPYWIATD